MTKKILILALIIVAALAITIFLFRDKIYKQYFKPTDTTIPQGLVNEEVEEELVILAENLDVPWDVIELPGGDLLVSERSGSIVRISDNQTYSVDGVIESGEGGLLGITLDPDFERNSYIYIYSTTETENGLTNRIEKYTFDNNSLVNQMTLLDEIPGASYHDGGALAFGPDGYLYATTGDAGIPDSAQDIDSLSGKILRMDSEGNQIPDNPFNNYVYSYGHRNPQGIAWDNEGRLWSTEHGPSGLESGYDEINLIQAGGNYGWPEIKGDEAQDGMIRPVAHSGADDTWAPASLTFVDGSLFFGGLRGQTLYQAKIASSGKLDLVGHFREEFGRLRNVTAIDSRLLFTTSNTDGRGDENPNDDKLYSVSLTQFNR